MTFNEDRVFKIAAYVLLLALALSGLVFPFLYYTKNESLLREREQLTLALQQLRAQANQARQQQAQQIEVLQSQLSQGQ